MHGRMIKVFFWQLYLFFIAAVSGYSQSSASFALEKWSIASGGGMLNSSHFSLNETEISGLATGTSESKSFVLNGLMIISTGIDTNCANSLITKTFLLQQNYPNPFNPATTIAYSLPQSSDVEIRIYNSKGQVIRTLVQRCQQTGDYQITWDGQSAQGQHVPSGVYFYQIIAKEFTDVKKMLLLH
jgi:hypothetical protein